MSFFGLPSSFAAHRRNVFRDQALLFSRYTPFPVLYDLARPLHLAQDCDTTRHVRSARFYLTGLFACQEAFGRHL